MLVSTYMYSLYKDKNRPTPFEFFKSKVASLNSSGSTGGTTPPVINDQSSSPEPEPLSWENPEDRPYIVAMFIVFIFEFVLLYYAILMAIGVSKNKIQLFFNLLGAIFFTLPYIVINTIFETSAYTKLTEGSEPFEKSSPPYTYSSSRLIQGKYV